MPALRLFLFGPLRIESDDREVEIQRRKAKALLIFLAVTRVRHRRETLAALLWPESDQRGAHGSLRRYLSELNRALGGDWIDADRETIGLREEAPLWLDTEQFQQHLAELQNHPHAADAVCPACIPPLTEAAALYRGDFLEGFSLSDCHQFDEWQFLQAEELRRSFARLLDRLVTAHLEKGEAEAAVSYGRRRVGLDPLHEPAHRQLMCLYAEAGEQAAALRQYELCATTLEEELGISPDEETVALKEQIRCRTLGADRESPTEISSSTRHNLPAQITPFIGRTDELAELEKLFADPTVRLVTILGPGGMGKTRLALEAAKGQLERHPDGVYLASLAPISAVEHMVPTIAAAIGFQFHTGDQLPERQLLDYLRRRQMLLVLDNCEHLLDGVELIRELLQTGPGLRVLATSRERLQLSGETVFTLKNMDFPTWETPEEALEYSAMQLFVQTARHARPEFEPDAHNLQYVARICRLVGGMPLGIILAAAWVSTLSPEEIAAELTRGFDLLETELRDLPDRQRNMRAVLAYSWRRLTETERACFMRLSVFRGGFTREAAREIADVSLSVLAHLVDKSFVQRVSETRYDIHELLRQYAGEKLREAGQEENTRDTHSAFYLDFLREREAPLADRRQVDALAELSAELENIRAAWHRAVQEQNYAGVDQALGGLFRWFWLARNRQSEGQALLRHALEWWAPAPGQPPQSVWMRLSARIVEQSGPNVRYDPEQIERVQRALDFARRRDDCAEIPFCLWALERATTSRLEASLTSEGKRATTEGLSRVDLLSESLQRYRELNDPFWIAQVLEDLGRNYRGNAELRNRAWPLLQKSLDIRRAMGNRYGMGRCLRELGFLAFVTHGREDEIEKFWQEGYKIRRELDDQQGIVDSLFYLSVLFQVKGDWQKAGSLIAQVATLASNIDESTYQKLTSRALEIIESMERTSPDPGRGTSTFPNRVTPFAYQLASIIFTLRFQASPAVKGQGFHRLLELTATDAEKAACLPHVALFLYEEGDPHQATALLALAFRYSHIAQGWIGHLPEIAELRFGTPRRQARI